MLLWDSDCCRRAAHRAQHLRAGSDLVRIQVQRLRFCQRLRMKEQPRPGTPCRKRVALQIVQVQDD